MGAMVSLVQSLRDCDESIREAVYRSIDLIGFKFPEKLRKVVIKPTLCYYWDVSTGETTDPRVVSAVIDYVREKGDADSEISIVESDATAMRTRFAFKALHYEEMAERKNVNVVNLSIDECINVLIDGFYFSEVTVPRIIKEADLFISVPKLKWHSITKISCALKNQFGCNPYRRKIRYHPHIHEVIADLNYVMRPDLCVVDGIIARGKYPKKFGLIIAGTDPVAVDSIAARIMGFNPRNIKYLALASEKGVGFMDNVTVVGEDLESLRTKFPGHGTREWIVSKFLQLGYKLYCRVTGDPSVLLGVSL